jgi:hypothetical protein
MRRHRGLVGCKSDSKSRPEVWVINDVVYREGSALVGDSRPWVRQLVDIDDLSGGIIDGRDSRRAAAGVEDVPIVTEGLLGAFLPEPAPLLELLPEGPAEGGSAPPCNLLKVARVWGAAGTLELPDGIDM